MLHQLPSYRPDDERIRSHLAPGSQLFQLDPDRPGDIVLVKMFKRFQDELDGLARSPRPKRAWFEFVGYGDIDAIAIADRDDPRMHYVGVNVGALACVEDMMMAMLAHPRLLKDIGDPSVERESSTDASEGFTPHVLLKRIEGTADVMLTGSRFEPVHPARSRFGWLLTHLMMEYLFLHESAHVICGHTNLADGLGLRLNAIGGRCATEDESRLRQAMEFDADNFAFRTLVASLVSRSTVLLDQTGLGSFSDKELLMAWAIASTAYFLRCDQADLSLEEFDRRTHPHPDLRHVLCGEATLGALEDNGHFLLAQKWPNVHEQALASVAEAWRILRVPGGLFSTLASDGSGIRSRYRWISDRLPALHNDVRRWDSRQNLPSN